MTEPDSVLREVLDVRAERSRSARPPSGPEIRQQAVRARNRTVLVIALLLAGGTAVATQVPHPWHHSTVSASDVAAARSLEPAQVVDAYMAAVASGDRARARLYVTPRFRSDQAGAADDWLTTRPPITAVEPARVYARTATSAVVAVTFTLSRDSGGFGRGEVPWQFDLVRQGDRGWRIDSAGI